MRAYNVSTILALALLSGLTALCAMADDWPNFRGPRYNGISEERDWGGDWAGIEPNVVWEQVVGTGFASIAVADGRVYTMGNTGTRDYDNSANEDVVFCFDADTGEVLWTHSYPARVFDWNYEGGPSATPTVADGRVYTLNKVGIAFCLDANDGEVVWERDLTTLGYGGPLSSPRKMPSWHFAGSAFVDGDLVIYNVGTHGTALYAADGTLAWDTGTGRPGYSTPLPFDWEGQRLLILMGETTFTAVKARTGQVIWYPPVSWVAGPNVNAADPVVCGNQVFISSGYGKGAALFDVDASNNLTEVWSNTDMQNKVNSSVLWEGYLYGPHESSGAMRCVEFSTGVVKWSKGGFGYGGLTLADAKLIALTEGGKLCIAEASPAGYHELAGRQILPSRCWAVPVLANGKIYARNSTYQISNPGKLVCVKLETTAPKVDAGSSVITWLQDGTTTVDLSGTVEDDTNDVATILWSVISSPPGSSVDIANDSAETTTATFVETGWYVLELQAVDAEAQEGSDRMEVRVYADSCRAARDNPISAYGAGPYHFDDDCVETFTDFAAFATERQEPKNFNDLVLFAAEWLEDGSLTADILYDAGRITLPGE